MKFAIIKLLSILHLFLFIMTSEAQTHADSMYIRYIAGAFLLNSTTTLSEDKKKEKYLELVEITGINAENAIKYLSEIRKEFKNWKKLQDMIKKELSDQNNPPTIP